MMKPRSAAAWACRLERSVARSREICPSLVTCGVTSSLMPVSRNVTLALVTEVAEVAALETSTTRTGMSSPTRMVAALLSWVTMLGSAWTSERFTVCKASRKVVKEKPPMAVEKARSRAGLGLVPEDDLGLDGDHLGPEIEQVHEAHDAVEVAPGVVDDDRVGGRIRRGGAALAQDSLERASHLADPGVVHPDDAGFAGLERVDLRQVLGHVHPENPAGELLRAQALGREDGVERLGPRLVTDLGGDGALDVLAQDA